MNNELLVTPAKEPVDSEVRRQAIDPTQSFLIQAPAGSGKTELVTDRMLALLATVEQPEEILAITFTRKAAGEMRQRVLEKLRLADLDEPTEEHKKKSWRLAQQVKTRDQQRNWNLQQHPARLRMMTFDSFCASLVKSMPFSAASGGALQISEQSTLLYQRAARSVLNKLETNEAVEFLVRHYALNMKALEQALIEMLAYRDQWQDQLTEGPQIALNKMILTMESFYQEALNKACYSMPIGFMAQYADALAEWADRFSDISVLKDLKYSPLQPKIDDIERWKALTTALLTKTGTFRKTVTQSDKVPAKSPLKERLVKCFKCLKDERDFQENLLVLKYLPKSYITEAEVELCKALFEVLEIALEELQLIFKSEGVVDFTEVALRAIQALGSSDNPSELLLKLDNKISHLLVDEFQDTNILQINLLEKLLSGWQQGDGRTLFLVGDPMQSIYRFRTADVTLFLKVFKDEQLAQLPLQTLKLQTNFRSTNKIVEWVNKSFKEIFPEAYDLEFGGVKYSPSIAFKEDNSPEPAVQHLIVPFIKNVEADEPAKRLKAPIPMPGEPDRNWVERYTNEELVPEQLQNAVVERIKASLNQAPEGQPYSIAILVKGRKHLGGLVKALRDAGIFVRSTEMSPLGGRPCVMDLLQVIKAVSHYEDRVAWLSVLRSPLCGLTLKSLHAIFGEHLKGSTYEQLQSALHNPDLSTLIGAEQALRFKHVVSLLLNREDLKQGLTFTNYLVNLWQALGGPLCYGSANDQTDVDVVFAKIDELAPYGILDMQAFEQTLEKLFAAADNHPNAVEVMTMHKAKGLEFEEVYLYGLHKRRAYSREALISFENYMEQGLMMGFVHSKREEKDDDASIGKVIRMRNTTRELLEEARLFYVAATRARQKLYLCYALECLPSKKDYKKASANMLKHLEKVTIDIGRMRFIEGPSDVDKIENSIKTPGITDVPVSSCLQLTAIQGLLSKRVVPASATTIKWRFEDLYFSAVGTVTHLWLYYMGRDRLLGWDEQKITQAQAKLAYHLELAGVTSNQLSQATQTVQKLLQRALTNPRLQDFLRQDQLYLEWSLFSGEGEERIIDAVQSRGDHWQIVDYKTNQRLQDESLPQFEQRLRDMYVEQMQTYCQYLQQFDGRPAKAALFALAEGVWIDIIS